LFAINYKYFTTIGLAGAAGQQGRILFSRDWTAGDSKFKLQYSDLIACTGCVLAAYVVTNDLACCNSVTCQWFRKIQGQLGIGGFRPLFMIC
jgi:hypothetical protein